MAVVRDNPYPGYNFLVSIDGVSDDSAAIQAAFVDVSGIGVEITPIEYRTGAESATVRKLPGLSKFSNVAFKRGITGDLRFWQWMRQTMHGDVQRATVTVVLLNEEREPVLQYQLSNAWPVKLEGPTLNAATNDVAVELMEICHEGLDIE